MAKEILVCVCGTTPEWMYQWTPRPRLRCPKCYRAVGGRTMRTEDRVVDLWNESVGKKKAKWDAGQILHC